MLGGIQQAQDPKAKFDPIPKLVTLAALLFLTAAKAMAQESEAPHASSESPARAHTREAVRRIVISIPDRKLALIEDGSVVKVYPVAVGNTDTPSPAGEFHIINRLTDPTWYASGKAVPPGKENPLGTRWIGLSEKGYGIHGTNAPKSIGKAASHGCIRMKKKDVEELFELVRVGDAVELIAERTEIVAQIFDSGKVMTAASQPAATASAPVVVAVGLGNL
jgi:lipoprotein-anchoring transpeptidase ErfK/SrfK